MSRTRKARRGRQKKKPGLAGTVKIDIFASETVSRNTTQRPFWAACRVARKFPAVGRELRRGGFADTEHLKSPEVGATSGSRAQNERTCSDVVDIGRPNKNLICFAGGMACTLLLSQSQKESISF